ncbi:MAG: class I SAM-dependent methyltransferase [Candidatus Aminicenantes bacterium]|nr:class I SAM-dependent methyltransferase [Candidatus Aminicenantes bacterium]
MPEKTTIKMICPKCQRQLLEKAGELSCPFCRRPFSRNPFGYLDFTLEAQLRKTKSTSEEYAAEQISSTRRFYQEYLKPWVDREKTERILDVGCGLGMGVAFLCRDGYEAYGIDLPHLAGFWARENRDPRHFINGDGSHTPFPDGYFDAVVTLGTIEHIGTISGHNTLAAGYRAVRNSFAAELLRVTKPGGRILISCPNKSFPVDIHHQPTDENSTEKAENRRQAIFDRTGLNLHLPFGRYHLLSFREIKKTFCRDNGAQAIRSLSARSYFAYKRTGSLKMLKQFKSLISLYMEHLPGPLRSTFLNPFLIVEVRR